MNRFERKIRQRILHACDSLNESNSSDYGSDGSLGAITPGLKLQVFAGGKLKVDLEMGEVYRYYDLASLTKIMFTVPAIMSLVDQRKLRIRDRLSEVLNWQAPSSVTVGGLLSHSVGMPAWAPFYKRLDMEKSSAERRAHLATLLRKRLSAAAHKKGIGEGGKAIYSDIDFILLGFVLERIEEQPLLEVWQNLVWRGQMPSLHFNPGNKPRYPRARYAPTEKCPWRKKILQGEVHDDNTWSFGGVSTHAGLFGTIDDVSSFGLLLRSGLLEARAKSPDGRVLSDSLASSATIKRFCRRAVTRAQGDWASGFMLPTRGHASCGRYFSGVSVGHTGFTGTSLWFDPKQDLLVSLLSNRVHPTRANNRFVKLRPLIHDIVCEISL